jgi:hypothetical protein
MTSVDPSSPGAQLDAARRRYNAKTTQIYLGVALFIGALVLNVMAWGMHVSETTSENLVLFARVASFALLAIWAVVTAIAIGKRRAEAKLIVMLEQDEPTRWPRPDGNRPQPAPRPK